MLIRYATVTTINQEGYFVTFLGETEQSTMQYKRLANYEPVQDDMVAILEDKAGKKIIIGRVM